MKREPAQATTPSDTGASRSARVEDPCPSPPELEPRARRSNGPAAVSPDIFKTLLLILVALSAASCATYSPRPLDAGENASTLARRSLDAREVRELAELNGIPVSQWPPERWTPELLTCAALALSPSLDVARAEWDVARAAIRTAGEIPNPSLVAGLEHKADSGPLSPWVSSIALSVPVETAGKRSARMDQAEALGAAAAARLDGSVWQTRSAVRQALIELNAASEISGLAHEAMDQSRMLASRISRRVEAGEDSRIELDRATAEASRRQTGDIESSARYQVALTDLAEAIGVPTSALRDVRFDLSTLKSLPPSVPDTRTLRELALTGRSDVIAQLAAYAASEAALRGEIRRQYPDLRIAPGFGWDQGSATWMIGIDAELPLFNRHEGPIAEATARRDLTAAQLSDLQARILADIDRARNALLETLGTLRLSEERVRLSHENSERMNRRFETGTIDKVALTEAELSLLSRQVEREEALAAAWKGVAAIEDLTQRPLSEIPETESR